MEIKRNSLQFHIIKFVFKVGFSFIIILFASYLILNYMLNCGILLPANYSDELIKSVKENIKSVPKISPELIPKNLKYVILDKQTLAVTNSNMSESELEKAKLKIKSPQSNKYGTNVYDIIETPKEYCIFHYKLIVQFANPKLRNLIQYPELMGICLLSIILLTTLYIFSLKFSKKIKKDLDKFSLITEKIEHQDLDFDVQHTSFIEYEKVMDSLDSLRCSLKKSLIEQFQQEQNKQEQISALAHDIKIPITVIKGNAELLNLTEKNEKALDYTNEIIEATNQIEQYTQLLIDASQNNQNFILHKEKYNIYEFLNIIKKDTIASIGKRNIHLEDEYYIPKELMFLIDYSSMKRAFMNIMINALEHTPNDSPIKLQISLYSNIETLRKINLPSEIIETSLESNNLLSFIITDSGKGFSSEALKKATELFYTDNKSRSQTNHYGIGLSYANKIIIAHNGKLILRNDVYTGGGQIVILLPIN